MSLLRYVLAATILLALSSVFFLTQLLNSRAGSAVAVLGDSAAWRGGFSEENCQRGRPFHLPEDLRDCKHPLYAGEFGRAPWTEKIVSNPLEPGCWNSTNMCSPFQCFPSCLTDENYTEMIKYWEPGRPGRRKIMVFQYGKVASTGIVKGLKLFADLTAAHIHTAEHAKQWLQGLRVDVPEIQQGFALSREWSLNSGLQKRCFRTALLALHVQFVATRCY